MAKGELFDDLRQYRAPLTDQQRKSKVDSVIRAARQGAKFFYTLKETCSILHISYDEMNTLIRFYKLDVVTFRDVYRVPWWSLAEYLLDPEDTLERELDECLRTRHKQS